MFVVGKDATEDFEYYGHSDKAREHMKEFLVGDYEVRVTTGVNNDCAFSM